MLFIVYLEIFLGLDIIDISKILGGKFFQKIIGIIFISYFMISASIMLRNFCEGLKIIYYPMTNIVFILLMFVIAVCIPKLFVINHPLFKN